ncbi:MAG: family 10 glycosylhydrolase [Planctomycetota bacterium]
MRGASALRTSTAALALFVSGCAALAERREAESIPAPAREFRGAWVATVANIDRPSSPGLPPEEQRREAIALLDRLAELGMNAVVLQVRPHADAFYPSELEPWSAYLTGEQGLAPEPFYDPLAFWIDEAHARGLELHAWFNPYRANHPSHPGELSPRSIAVERPELVVTLGSKGYLWMDPALREVQDHTVAVVLDVVRRYDVDGVHFDDYFYPYRSYNDGRDFPDDASWSAYQERGGGLSRGDWRTASVNALIQRLGREVHRIDPEVKFGISPFGIWRPEHPASIQGMDAVEQLHADARHWLRRGWVDYLMPQLYWPIAQVPQSFPVLLGWWARQNSRDRHVWPGAALTRLQGEELATEIANDVMIARGMTPESPGLCLFSAKWLLDPQSAVARQLTEGQYAAPALVPASPWLDRWSPNAPHVEIIRAEGGDVRVQWRARGNETIAQWVVYEERDGEWSHSIAPGAQSFHAVDSAATRVAVSAVDRAGNEGRRTLVDVEVAR